MHTGTKELAPGSLSESAERRGASRQRNLHDYRSRAQGPADTALPVRAGHAGTRATASADGIGRIVWHGPMSLSQVGALTLIGQAVIRPMQVKSISS